MIRNLQALRAFAALSVIFVHLDRLLGALGVRPFGGGGVDLFFVISGFVMVHTTMRRPTSPLLFLRDRVTRIAPMYWLITLAVFALAIVKPSLLQATRADVGQLVKSLLFIPFRRANGTVEPVLFVGWSLNYEMFFYALFAVGLAFRRYLVGVALVIAVLVALVCANLALHPQEVYAAFYTSPRMIEFGLGMALAVLIARAPDEAGPGWKFLCLLAFLGAPILTLEYAIWPDFPGIWLSAALATPLVGAAVLLERWGLAITWKPLLLLGDASYVLYLTHPFVTQVVQKVNLPISPILGIELALALSMAVAVFIHLLVEKPLTRLVREWTGARGRRADLATSAEAA